MFQCYDIASMVIEIANRELRNDYHKDYLLDEKFKEICGIIDNFMIPEKIPGCNEPYKMDVDVDIDTLEIIIGLEFDLCEFGREDPMYNIFQMANEFKILTPKKKTNRIRMEIRFPGVWVMNE